MANEEFYKISRLYFRCNLAVVGIVFLLFVNILAYEDCVLDYTAKIDFNDEFTKQEDYGWGIYNPNYIWEYISCTDDLPEDISSLVPYAEGIWLVRGSLNEIDKSLLLVPRYGNYSNSPKPNNAFSFSITYYSTVTSLLENANGNPDETVEIPPSQPDWTTFSFEVKSPFMYPITNPRISIPLSNNTEEFFLLDTLNTNITKCTEVTTSTSSSASTSESPTPETTPSIPTTSEASTTEINTSEASTTEASTSEASTTEASTTEASTTEASTLEASTTEASSSESSTTEINTAEASTTETSTSEASTTEASTLEASTTEASTSEASTTEASSSEASTTEVNTSEASTTEANTSEASTTEASTSEAPTNETSTSEVSTTNPASSTAITSEVSTTEVASNTFPTSTIEVSSSTSNEYETPLPGTGIPIDYSGAETYEYILYVGVPTVVVLCLVGATTFISIKKLKAQGKAGDAALQSTKVITSSPAPTLPPPPVGLNILHMPQAIVQAPSQTQSNSSVNIPRPRLKIN